MMDNVQPEFERFFAEAEPRLRRALAAGFGADLGRQAALEALTWAWEHWDRVCGLDNPVGYLYRVGRTAALRSQGREVPLAEVDGLRSTVRPTVEETAHEPQLVPGLRSLSEQQRTAVLLVHGFGYTLRDAAEVLGVTASTVHRDCERGIAALRTHLEVEDVH